MEIKYGSQVKIDHLTKRKSIDLFIFSENHEKRAFSLYTKLQKANNILKTVAFCYKQSVVEQKNDGINKILITESTEIYKFLDEELEKISSEEITLVIDYSCMTKPWYYSIVLYLKNRESNFKKICAYFSYTPSKFNEPKAPKPNKEIGPLPGKYIVPTDKPKALIVCLGYEQNKAEGIIEHLDPKVSYIFYTNPASEKKFVQTLETNNKSILKERLENTITYPFNDLLFLERKLTSLYFQLKDEYSVIIAPLGPKPFTFISIMMSVKYNDIDIWRVGSGYDINEYDNEPCDDKSYIICEVLFEKD